MEIEIRPAQTIADYRACEELQRCTWSMDDSLEIVPLHLLLSAQRGGGLVLVARDGEETLGFVFGFLGRTPGGRLKHCSHLMAVAPGAQDKGIGYGLKLAQREAVLAQGLDLVTWTYDPLESKNAYLNIHKLGGVCRTYLRDLYGALVDGLNVGLPSDRFEVEWWLESDHVKGHLAGDRNEENTNHASTVLSTTPAPGGLLAPNSVNLKSEVHFFSIKVPANFQSVKSADPELAMEWRVATRQVFEAYFARGYAVVDYRSQIVYGERQNRYVLARAAAGADFMNMP